MTLLSVSWLWALWLLPALVAMLILARGRARRRVGRFLGEMGPRLLRGGGSGGVRAGLVLGAVLAAVVGLARPAWGVRYEEVRSEGVDVVVLLDVSRSMLAEDATPDRLTRAKLAVGKLVDRLAETGGHRVALVAFAGTPSVRCPLTVDHGYVREVLAATDTRSAPRGGTLIGDAIRRALTLLDVPGEQFRSIVLLTDGEDHESFPLEAARAAAEQGVVIFAVGIGDAGQGTRIPVRRDDGSLGFLLQDGEPVLTRLDEETLLEITRATRGAYVPAGTRTIPLDRIFEEAVASRTGALRDVTRRRRPVDRFQWAVGLALLLALASRLVGARPEAAA